MFANCLSSNWWFRISTNNWNKQTDLRNESWQNCRIFLFRQSMLNFCINSKTKNPYTCNNKYQIVNNSAKKKWPIQSVQTFNFNLGNFPVSVLISLPRVNLFWSTSWHYNSCVTIYKWRFLSYVWDQYQLANSDIYDQRSTKKKGKKTRKMNLNRHFVMAEICNSNFS